MQIRVGLFQQHNIVKWVFHENVHLFIRHTCKSSLDSSMCLNIIWGSFCCILNLISAVYDPRPKPVLESCLRYYSRATSAGGLFVINMKCNFSDIIFNTRTFFVNLQ